FGLASIPVDRSRRVSWPYPLRTVLHLVRFNDSYHIRHFCNARVLNSLHFLNGASAGFLRTLAASRPPRYATTRGPYRRDHSPAGGRILRGMRSLGPTALSSASISRLACAWSWTWAIAQAPAQPQMTARWEPEAPQAPHLARATSIAARVSRPPLRGTVAFIAFRDELTCAIAITQR